jgi:hypothetical protein
MKRLMQLRMAVIAIASLLTLALAGSASAEPTELFTGNSTLPGNTTLQFSLQPGTSAVQSTTDGKTIIDTCTTLDIDADTTAATGNPLGADITSFTFGTGCSFFTQVLTLGKLTFTKIAGTDNATVIGDASVTTVDIGVTCRYGYGAGTHLGVLIGTTDASGHASFTANAVINEQEPKAFLCPDTTRWHALFIVTTPTGLNVRT